MRRGSIGLRISHRAAVAGAQFALAPTLHVCGGAERRTGDDALTLVFGVPAVARITRTIEIAMTIAATPDQVMPLARLLTLATTAAEIESINADMERTIGKMRHGPSAR